jgi:hypothetical protein
MNYILRLKAHECSDHDESLCDGDANVNRYYFIFILT